MMRIGSMEIKGDVAVLQKACNKYGIDTRLNLCVQCGVDGREATCDNDVYQMFLL